MGLNESTPKNYAIAFGTVGAIVVAIMVWSSLAGGSSNPSSRPPTLTDLERVYGHCRVAGTSANYAPFLQLEDGGRSLVIDKGPGSVSTEIQALGCVLAGLSTPDSITSLMSSTTAMMGRQTDAWDHFDIAWSYHPDTGMNVVIEEN